MNGKGTYEWSNGNRYQGDFRDGLRHGQGTLFEADGLVYVGQWEKGLKHGEGKEFWQKGFAGNHDSQVVYEGQWKDGKKNGQGTLSNPDGATVKGLFKDNKLTDTLSFVQGTINKPLR